jgi:MFS family permease
MQIRDFNKREMAAVVAAVCVGEGGLLTTPFILGGAADRFGLSDGGAGLVTALQFVAMTVVAAVLAVSVHKLDRRKLVLGAAVLALGSHFVSAMLSDWNLFLASRVGIGIGEGALLAVGTAAAAATPKPQRTFSIITFGYVILATAIYLSWPAMLKHYGPISIFYIALAIVVIGMPFLLAMPRLEPTDDTAPVLDRNVWRPFPWILVGIACLYMGVNSLWAFSERIAVTLEMSHDQVVMAFVVMVLVVPISPIAANFAQKKWGFRKPIFAGVILQSVACAALGGALFYEMYFVAFVLMNIALLYLVPMYRALTGVIDPGGRVAAASIVVQSGATALGPALMSLLLLAGGGFLLVGIFGGMLAMLSGVFAWKAARVADGVS